MIHATLWGGVIFFNIKIDIHVISMLYKEMEKIKNLIIKKTMYLLLQRSGKQTKQNKILSSKHFMFTPIQLI
jgi:hypothetical protein